jgi:hypothetical protein
MLQRELNRAANIAFDAVNVTVMHLRRIVGFVSGAATRTGREVEDLVWDYQDLAGDLHRGHGSAGADNVIPFDARRRAIRYRGVS